MIMRDDVERAAVRVGAQVRRTPVLEINDRFSFKLEFLQHTGSFKARGAFNRILAARERGELDPAVGIVVASGGNAGLAYAYAAANLGVPATVFVPSITPAVKVEKLRAYAANVVIAGTEYAMAHEAALEHATATGALAGHAYDQPEMAAGAGMLALELVEQKSDGFDTVLVAVGGGGLLAGIAAALEGDAHVVGVEPETIPTLNAAPREGRPVDVPVSGVAADSLGARRLGDIAFAVATRTGVGSLLVTDADIVAARRELWQRHRIVVEHGAATAMAAVTAGAYVPQDGERVVVVLCGANTDPADLGAPIVPL